MLKLYYWINGEVVEEHWGSETGKRSGYYCFDASEELEFYK